MSKQEKKEVQEPVLKKRKTLIPGIITIKTKDGWGTDFFQDDLVTNSSFFKTLIEGTSEKIIEIDEEEFYLSQLFNYLRNKRLELPTTK